LLDALSNRVPQSWVHRDCVRRRFFDRSDAIGRDAEKWGGGADTAKNNPSCPCRGSRFSRGYRNLDYQTKTRYFGPRDKLTLSTIKFPCGGVEGRSRALCQGWNNVEKRIKINDLRRKAPHYTSPGIMDMVKADFPNVFMPLTR